MAENSCLICADAGHNARVSSEQIVKQKMFLLRCIFRVPASTILESWGIEHNWRFCDTCEVMMENAGKVYHQLVTLWTKFQHVREELVKKVNVNKTQRKKENKENWSLKNWKELIANSVDSHGSEPIVFEDLKESAMNILQNCALEQPYRAMQPIASTIGVKIEVIQTVEDHQVNLNSTSPVLSAHRRSLEGGLKNEEFLSSVESDECFYGNESLHSEDDTNSSKVGDLDSDSVCQGTSRKNTRPPEKYNIKTSSKDTRPVSRKGRPPKKCSRYEGPYEKFKYKCKLCMLSFYRLRYQLSHNKRLHPEVVEEFKDTLLKVHCNICPTVFQSNGGLKVHMFRVHNIKDDTKREFPCPECGKAFYRQVRLEHHLKQCHQTTTARPTPLPESSLAEPNASKSSIASIVTTLTRNVLTTKEKTDTCRVAGARTRTGAKGRPAKKPSAYEGPYDKFRYKCEPCQLSFYRVRYHLSHNKKEHPEILETLKESLLRVTCELCSKSMQSEGGLKIHMLRVHNTKLEGQTRFPCPREGCSKVYDRKNRLHLHIAAKHDKVPPQLQCDDCHMAFYSSTQLLKHRQKMHMNIKEICDFCGKTFNCTLDLQIHRWRHTAKGQQKIRDRAKQISKKVPLPLDSFKVHQCHLCGKSFTGVNGRLGLNNHIRFTHEKRFIHKCDACDKHFISRLAKSRHMFHAHKIGGWEVQRDILRRKRLESQYRCKVADCGSYFLGKDAQKNFEQHVREKHGATGQDAKFNCEYCGRGFCYAYRYKKHIRTHTNGKIKNQEMTV